MAIVVRQPNDQERQSSEKRPMLLGHILPNNRAPSEFNAISYAGETLNRSLAGVEGRRGYCHDSAAIMDRARWRNMADIRYWRLSVHTSSYKIQSRSVDSARS